MITIKSIQIFKNMLYLQSKYLTNTDSDRQILHKCVWNLTIKDPPTSSPHRYGPFNTLQVPLYLWEPHNVIQTQKPHKWYWSCMSVLELLLDRSTNPLYFWWKGASHTRITPYLYFVTLNYTSRSPRPLRSPSPVHKKSTLD